MRFVLPLAFAVVAASCGPNAPAMGPTEAAPAPSGPVELASFPAPAFLENLIVQPTGEVLFTSYLGRTVERIDASGARSTFASLEAHPVSILPFESGYLVAAHGKSFTEGPSVLGSGALLMLDAAGAVTATIPAPMAGFLNGMVALPNGTVLIADSAKAQILAFNPAARTLEPWFADPVLAPQAEPFRPGANGLKLKDGALIVSSSATRTLYRLAIGADGAAQGGLEPLVQDLPGADDFIPLPDGGFIVATHGPTVARVAADGAISTLTDDARLRGNTAVALQGAGAERRVVVLGTGGLSEGGAEPGVVLSLPLPE